MKQPHAYPLPEATEETYAGFLARAQPTDVRPELAMQRTFLQQTLEALRVQSSEELDGKAATLAQGLDDTLLSLGVEETNRILICKVYLEKVRPALGGMLPTALDPRVLRAVGGLLSEIVSTAERMERIQKGRKIKVQIDNGRLSWLIRTFIVRFVPKERWPEVVATLRQHHMEEVLP